MVWSCMFEVPSYICPTCSAVLKRCRNANIFFCSLAEPLHLDKTFRPCTARTKRARVVEWGRVVKKYSDFVILYLISDAVAAHPIDALGGSRFSHCRCQELTHCCFFNDRKPWMHLGKVRATGETEHLLASCGQRCTSLFGPPQYEWQLRHIEIACLGSQRLAARIELCRQMRGALDKQQKPKMSWPHGTRKFLPRMHVLQMDRKGGVSVDWTDVKGIEKGDRWKSTKKQNCMFMM